MSIVQKHTSQPGVQLTEAAAQHILACIDKQTGAKGIRLSVKKTGCSGLSYVLDFIEEIPEQDLRFDLTETYAICIDRMSYPYLKGLEIDYVKQGINYKFVFNNPNQKGQCGCGESFTV